MSNAMHLQRAGTPGAGKKNYRLSGLVQESICGVRTYVALGRQRPAVGRKSGVLHHISFCPHIVRLPHQSGV